MSMLTTISNNQWINLFQIVLDEENFFGHTITKEYFQFHLKEYQKHLFEDG